MRRKGSTQPPTRAPHPFALRTTLIAAALALLGIGNGAGAAGSMHGHHDMSDAAMQREMAAWFAAHPAHGGSTTADVPSATFNASGFAFNADGNTGTNPDTVHIFAGQFVKWQWIDGSHTVTSGTGSADPNMGVLFNVGLNVTTPTFMRRFDAVGTVPFFCQPHEAFGMKGAVAVSAPADTFRATGFVFDHDGNTGTNPDTVHIQPGDAVMWRWVDGTHTITSGTGVSDPNVGVMFDHALDLNNTVFTFQYTNAGVFPFFCRFHETFGMKGVVVVGAVTGVPPAGARLGFASLPAPNPSRSGFAFRFALPAAGHARAEVLDAQGRRVATLLDRWMESGTWPASWDARIGAGRAPTGVYYVRVTLPGYDAVRSVTLTR